MTKSYAQLNPHGQAHGDSFPSCDHCGLDVIVPYPLKAEKEDDPQGLFCCHGCRNVYQILHQQGLENYYHLKKESGEFVNPAPAKSAELRTEDFAFLDHEDFQRDHVKNVSSGVQVRFYLEGIHCLACLWLIEHLPQIQQEVKEARLNMAESVVTIVYDPSLKLSKLAAILSSWGHKPHPLQSDGQREKLQKQEERKILKRIGIAAFGAGNIMIYAVSLYGGASGTMAQFFGLITLLLATPVLTYSAWPFYQTAWGNLRSRHISIDLPIAIALIIGGLHGVMNTLRGIPENYFDSLTTLVFLLLFSRFIVKKAGQSGLNRDLVKSFFSLGNVKRWNPQAQAFESVTADYLKAGDEILLPAGKALPSDGVILEGESSLNTATLTGEPLPFPVKVGDRVQAGTVNNEYPLKIQVTATANETQWGDLLQKIESGWAQKGPIVSLLDRVAEKFVLVVFSLSVLTILYFWLGQNAPLTGFERALSLIIISCPCALGLAGPLAMTRGLSQAASEGMIIKDEESFERLSKVKALALDKTGTLTQGQIKVLHWPENWSAPPNFPTSLKNFSLYELVYILECHSRHPVAQALCEEASRKISPERLEKLKKLSQEGLGQKREILGHGVELTIENSKIRLGKTQSDKNHSSETLHVELQLDDETLTSFTLEDQIRPETQSVLEKLKKKSLELWILTGDTDQRAKTLAKQLSFSSTHVLGDLKPQDKFEFLKQQQKQKSFAMIGDGANDALALNQASVGIAVQGSAEVGLKAADIYLTKSGLSSVEKLFQLSEKTMKLIKRNLTFSLIYNILGATGALSGVVSPLWAAIFMPLSSLTVLGSTLLGKLRSS